MLSEWPCLPFTLSRFEVRVQDLTCPQDGTHGTGFFKKMYPHKILLFPLFLFLQSLKVGKGV